MTGKDEATSFAFTLKEEPVTVTVSPALPAALDRLRVARFVHANAAAPATTVAAAEEPKTRETFLRRFIAKEPTFALGLGTACTEWITCCPVSIARASPACNKRTLAIPYP